MNNRELLELAAKAAGYTAKWCDFQGMEIRVGYQGGLYVDEIEDYWNPLTDDGDRYRLAKKLKLVLDFDGNEVRWYAPNEDLPHFFRWKDGDETDCAYAIVRAAAEIGKAMP